MKPERRPLLAAALLAACCPLAAAAAPPSGGDDLQRNDGVSRRIWTPASGEVMGLRISAGLALGLHDLIRPQLGARVAPVLVIETGLRSRLSLLAGENRGAMLMLQLAH